MDLGIIVDDSVPSHMVVIALEGETGVRVTVSPRVEPQALVALNEQVALAIADAVDNRPALR